MALSQRFVTYFLKYMAVILSSGKDTLYIILKFLTCYIKSKNRAEEIDHTERLKLLPYTLGPEHPTSDS